MQKGTVFVIGLCFILYLLWNLYEFYGKIESFQFLSLITSLMILIGFLAMDIWKSTIKISIERLSRVDIIGIYFSSTITILIGGVGIIGVVLSILNGAFYVAYEESAIELIKLRTQTLIWFGFILYFLAVFVVLFIYPLKKQLDLQ